MSHPVAAPRLVKRTLVAISAFASICLGPGPARAEAPVLLMTPTGVAGDKLGSAPTSVGDFNGDGYDDLAVGAPRTGQTGLVYIYYGGPAADDVPDVTLTGNEIDDKFASALDGVGDMNGDGFDDVIVGAFGEASNGRAHIYFGGPTPPAPVTLNDDDFTGTDFGRQVRGLGDVNGDGFTDAIVGAVFAPPGQTGEAYVYFGGAIVDGTADLVLVGESTGDHFGRYFGAGNLNGDGFDDILVKATHAGGGRLYVFFGSTSPDAVADLVFGDDLGIPATSGDVNGDGYDDLVLGANNPDSDIKIYYGGPAMDTVADVVLDPEFPNTFFGWDIDVVGDVNVDGYADILAGAWGVDEPFSNAGRAYLFYGGPALDSTPEFVYNGAAADDQLGLDVGPAGDFNGDGSEDFVFAAKKNDDGGADAGKAYVYGGAAILACCLPNGCLDLTPGDCVAMGGTSLPFGTTCDGADFDHDGVPDSCDECPLDPKKVLAGDCGCAAPDSSSSAFATEFGQPGFGDGEFNLLTSMALDAAGNIFALQLEPDEIQVFGPDGTYDREEFSGGFTDIDIDATGRIHAIAGNSVVVSGEKFTIGGTGSGEGQFDSPIGLALDPDGNIWVSDTGNDRIQGFDRFGSFIRAFGTSGSGNGQLDRPYLIFADTDRIYVAERDNHRVQVFDKEGNSLFTIGGPVAGSGDGEFDQPTAVAADAAGRIYVTDTNNDRVQVFDDEGNFLSEFGSAGTGDGQFGWAWDLAISRSGRLWVSDAEAGFERVQGFDPAPQTLNFSASDGILEVGTVLAWSPICNSDALWRIRRTGGPSGTVQLAVLPQADSTYVDATGLPTVIYDYELTFIDQNTGFEKSENDNGHRTIFAPTNLTATDQTREDAIELRWNDKSSIEDSTRIYVRAAGTADPFLPLVTLGADFRVYLDSTAVPGSRYEYCVEAATANGEVSTQDCGAVGELGALNAPGNVRASNGTYTDRVRIEWEDLTLLEEGFNVYRRPAGTQDAFTLVGTADADSVNFEDTTGLGSAWQYGVTAFYNDGSLVESPMVLDNGIGGPETMAPPTDVTASVNDYDDRVFLSWTDPGNDEDKFEIYREDDQGANQLISEVQASVTQFDDLDAVPGESREYCVVAVSELGGSSLQSLACTNGTRAEIVPPIDLLATDAEFENRTILTWDTESTTTTVFKVIRDGVVLHVLPGTARTYSDKTGQSGVTYTYHVQGLTVNKTASDTTGGGESGSRQLTLPTDLEATNTNDDGVEDGVDLRWEERSSFETGYHVFRRVVGDTNPPELIAELPRNRNSYSDKTGDVGMDYEYHVAPIDAFGVDAAPVFDSGRRDLLAVTGLSASDDEFEQKIVIEWNDESAAETHYEVWRDGALLTTLSADTESYEDLGLAVGVSHSYEVFPVDNTGPGVGPDTPPVGTPSDVGSTDILAPASVSASDDYSDKVTVSWVDRSEVETGYEVGYEDNDGTLNVLSTVGANVTSYVDASPPAGEIRNYYARTTAAGDASGPVFDSGRTQAEAAVQTIVPEASGFTVGSGFLDAIDVDGDVAILGGDATRAGFRILRRDESGRWNVESEIASRNGDPSRTKTRWAAIDGDWATVQWFENSGAEFTEFYRFDGTTWIYAGDGPDSFGFDMQGQHAIFKKSNGVFIWEEVGGTWAEVDSTIQSGILSMAIDGDGYAFGKSVSSVRTIDVYDRAEDGFTYSMTLNNDMNDSFFGEAGIDKSGSYISVGGGDGVYLYEDGVRVPIPFPNPTGLAGTELEGDVLIAHAEAEPVKIFVRGREGNWNEALQVDTSPPSSDFPFCDYQNGTLSVRWSFDGSNFVHFVEVLNPAGSVRASDNEFENKVRVEWEDRTTLETSFRVLRDGAIIAEVPADTRTYSDFDARPGIAHEYEVIAASTFSDGFSSGSDIGRRQADGFIGGRVTTRSGTGVRDITVCLDPPVSQSLVFDAVGGYVEVEDGLPLDNGFTVELWATVQDQTGGVDRILWSSADGNYFLGSISGILSLHTPTTDNDYTLPSDRGWHHYAVTVDSGDTPALYIDGVLATPSAPRPENSFSRPRVAFGGPTTTADLWLGGDPVGDDWWNGQMDDARVWSRVLSASEIATQRDTRIDVASPGLFAYLTLDEPDGAATSDLTLNGTHGRLIGGVGRSGIAAPVEVCTITDESGNYAISEILYGDGRAFQVIPEEAGRIFDPEFKVITIDQENPVANEVPFSDITSYALSGFVGFENTTCAAEQAEVVVDGETVGTTDANGEFDISVLPGAHTLEVRIQGQTVAPLSRDVFADDDVVGLDFAITTTRRLDLAVGGGCPGVAIGDVTLKITSLDGCHEVEVTLSEADALILPPLEYQVEVSRVTNAPAPPLSNGQIQEFFDALGPQSVDLTLEDQKLEFIYRAPIKLTMAGLPAWTCGPFLAPDNSPISGPPDGLMSQLESATITFEVVEDYGSTECKVDSATITLFNEVSDIAEPIVIPVTNGFASYDLVAVTPNAFPGRADANGLDRSFQKAFTAVAEVEGSTDQVTKWVVTQGARPRAGTFYSAVTDEMPILILHDPPGDASYAYWEEGTEVCTELQSMRLDTSFNDRDTRLQWGLDISVTALFISGDVTSIGKAGFGFRHEVSVSRSANLQYCLETTERFSTSDSDLFVGEGGDVFVGSAMNLLYAPADNLELDGCRANTFESIRVGVDGEEPFATTFAYSRSHIENVILPQLERFIASPSSADSVGIYKNQMENWKSKLAVADTLTAQGLRSDARNRSFSAGAVFEEMRTESNTETITTKNRSYTYDSQMFGFGFKLGGQGLDGTYTSGFDYEISSSTGDTDGSTLTTGYVLADDDPGDSFSVDIATDPVYGTPVFQLRAGTSSCPWEAGTAPRDEVGIAISPLLNPGVTGDVPVGEAAEFTLTMTNFSPETREYYLRSEESDNPGGATISVNGADASVPRSFFLAGNGTGNNVRDITVTVERGPRLYKYPDLKLQAVPPCEFELFRAGGQLQQAQTVPINVDFEAPCSDVTISSPVSGYNFNLDQSTMLGDVLPVRIKDFTLKNGDGSEEFVDGFNVQYRRVGGTANWQNILPMNLTEVELGVLDPDTQQLVPKADYDVMWDVPGDGLDGVDEDAGQYELRAFAVCGTDFVFSNVVAVRVDRQKPRPFGAPEPADKVLSLGDQIRIVFDESIDCGTVDVNTVKLYAPDGSEIGVERSCNGNTIIIEPGDLGDYEGQTVTMKAGNVLGGAFTIQDRAGNPMLGRETQDQSCGETSTQSETWCFDVRLSDFAWANDSVVEAATFEAGGAVDARLVNGNAADADFTLVIPPEADWLSTSTPTGTVTAGGTLDIAFDYPTDLGETEIQNDPDATATFQTTVTAEVDTNDDQTSDLFVDLDIRIDITCGPPAWNVNASLFEHTMSAIVQLDIDSTISSDPDDMIGAFVGNQLRGAGSPEGDKVYLTIHSNRSVGEIVRFKIFDASTCHLYGSSDRTVRFEKDKRWNPPEAITAEDAIPGFAQSIDVTTGWTWFSLNLASDDMTIFSVLGDLNLAPGDLVKSYSQFNSVDEDLEWSELGTLTEFDNKQGYLIHLDEAGIIIHEGTPVAGDLQITINNGWNWIGYPPANVDSVHLALASFNANDFDVIKSQTEFAQFQTGDGWMGSLKVLEPGKGYKLYSGQPLPGTLTFPANPEPAARDEESGGGILAGWEPQVRGGRSISLSGLETDGDRRAFVGGESLDSAPKTGIRSVTGRKAVKKRPARSAAMQAAFDLGWSLPQRGFQHNMTMIAQIDLNGAPLTGPAVLGAFVGDEVRGVSEVMTYGLGQSVAFLMIHSDEAQDEKVTFQVLDTNTDQLYEVSNRVDFLADGNLGTIEAPWTLHATPVIDGTDTPVSFQLGESFPNPARLAPAQIGYALPIDAQVEIELFDVQGRSVRTLVDGMQPAGRHVVEVDPVTLTSGIYFYRMRTDSFEQVRKLTVVR